MADRHPDDECEANSGASVVERNRRHRPSHSESHAQSEMKVRVFERGTTMLETLVVAVIFMTVSSVVFSMFVATARNFSYSTKTVTLQTDLAGGLNVFLDDVSLAGVAGYTT